MANKSIVFFLGLCPIIPLAAHFAEGVIFVAEFWLLFSVGILSKMLINYFRIDKMSRIITYMNIIFAAALYAQAVGLVFPVIAVSLEIYIYMTAFSYILIISIGLYDSSQYPLEMPILYSILLTAVSIAGAHCIRYDFFASSLRFIQYYAYPVFFASYIFGEQRRCSYDARYRTLAFPQLS